MIYRFDLYIPEGERIPNLDEFKSFIDKYSLNNKGYVKYRDSLYDYQYDMTYKYHDLITEPDGIILTTLIEDNRLFVVIDTDVEIDTSKNYLGFVRCNLQSEKGNLDDKDVLSNIKKLSLTSIYGVELVRILDNELDATRYVSEVVAL